MLATQDPRPRTLFLSKCLCSRLLLSTTFACYSLLGQRREMIRTLTSVGRARSAAVQGWAPSCCMLAIEEERTTTTVGRREREREGRGAGEGDASPLTKQPAACSTPWLLRTLGFPMSHTSVFLLFSSSPLLSGGLRRILVQISDRSLKVCFERPVKGRCVDALCYETRCLLLRCKEHFPAQAKRTTNCT